MFDRRAPGFTLIELLTVIAIIAILASITFPMLSRARLRAQVTTAQTNMRNVGTAMTAYLGKSQTNSYPAIYGYRRWEERTVQNPLNPPSGKTLSDMFVLRPYTVALEIHMVEDLSDPFSSSFDTNATSPLSFNYPAIDILEWGPVGLEDPISKIRTFPPENQLYLGAYGPAPEALPRAGDEDDKNLMGDEYDRALQTSFRPFVYVPVNASQAKRVNAYYQSIMRDPGAPLNKRRAASVAGIWEPANEHLSGLSFPPPRYDSYVLISVGPTNSTSGVVAGSDISGLPPHDLYHIAALRTYWLATRDLNESGVPDFDHEGRARGEEVNFLSYQGKGIDDIIGTATDPFIVRLPDGTAGYGPLIYHVQ